MFFLLLITLLLAWLLTRPFYWWQRGVPSVLPLPLFGNSFSSFYLSYKDFFDSFYYKFPNSPYVGIFLFTRPVLLLCDPEIIMEVMEEKVMSFSSHGIYVNQKLDFLSKSVFHIDGTEWKNVKTIVDVGKESIERLIAELERQLQDNQEELVEVRSLAMFLAIDLTSETLFGVQTPVFQERTRSEFYQTAKELNNFTSMIRVLIGYISPALYDMCKFTTFTEQANDYLMKIIDASVKARKYNADTMKNFMDGLLGLQERDSKVYSEEFLISQSAVMWAGGVETSANALGFVLYELACKKSVQDELRGKLRTSDGEKLLKALIKGLWVESGTLVMIPVVSIHADNKHFPNPFQFKLDRDLPKGAYLAYGAGPRTCLGMMMSNAVLEETLTSLLEKYEFSLSERPLILEPMSYFTSPKGGVWLNVRRVQPSSTTT